MAYSEQEGGTVSGLQVPCVAEPSAQHAQRGALGGSTGRGQQGPGRLQGVNTSDSDSFSKGSL